MKLFVNTTSPFVRLVRLAMAEKGLTDRVETEIVDPWADAAPFLEANAAARVPTLVTDTGTPIAEAFLILRYLDAQVPEPSVWPDEDLERTLAVAAPALGAIEAAASIIIGRKSSADFDTDPVGRKRHRTMVEGLKRLDANPPHDFADRPDIAGYAGVTVVDYIRFRFPDRDWLDGLPTLAAWRARQQDRASVASTQPHA